MTRIFIVLLSTTIAVLYFFLYGGGDNTFSLPLMHSRLEWHVPVWLIKSMIMITAAGWVVLICQRFTYVQGTIWAVVTVLVSAFSIAFAWYLVWKSIECEYLKYFVIFAFWFCTLLVSFSLGSRRVQ